MAHFSQSKNLNYLIKYREKIEKHGSEKWNFGSKKLSAFGQKDEGHHLSEGTNNFFMATTAPVDER
jgi:hypothetical protein